MHVPGTALEAIAGYRGRNGEPLPARVAGVELLNVSARPSPSPTSSRSPLHDPETWTEPDRFDLDRFVGAQPDPFGYFPQGGGDPATGHRCPGERLAIELIKTAVRHLVEDRPPAARPQPYPLNRIPTRPLPG